jgi:hypothetical protein
VETRPRTALTGLAALVVVGVHAQAIGSCDISGSSVMFQGIEKRDGTPARTQTQAPATQRPAQGKAEPRETSPATASNPPR